MPAHSVHCVVNFVWHQAGRELLSKQTGWRLQQSRIRAREGVVGCACINEDLIFNRWGNPYLEFPKWTTTYYLSTRKTVAW